MNIFEKEIIEFLDNELSIDEIIDELKNDTRATGIPLFSDKLRTFIHIINSNEAEVFNSTTTIIEEYS